MTTGKDIEHRFKYHKPDEKRGQEHQRMRNEFRVLADIVNVFLPEGREKSLCLTKLEEGLFWANAAIARRGEVDD